MSDHLDTLRGDLERLDRKLHDLEWAPLDHRVIDFQAWRENRKRLHAHRAELYRAIEAEAAREEAEADLGGDAA